MFARSDPDSTGHATREWQNREHEIIAYVDDGAVVDPKWLAAIAAAFEDPAVSVVTGLVLAAELVFPAQHVFEQYGGMGKGMDRRDFVGSQMTAYDKIATHCAGVGANMAFRRQTFERVGLFDTALDAGTPSNGGGDLDIFHRVLVSGLTIRYEPAAVVWHYHRRDLEQLRKQLYTNGRAFGVYLLKILRSALRTAQFSASVCAFELAWYLARRAPAKDGHEKRAVSRTARVGGALGRDTCSVGLWRHLQSRPQEASVIGSTFDINQRRVGWWRNAWSPVSSMFDLLKRRMWQTLRETMRPSTPALPDPVDTSDRPQIAYDPQLVPPLHLMRTEGIDVLEEWFRWGEEWSVMLRAFGGVRATSDVLEIGCGLGRIAFPLRYVLRDGTYRGFDISMQKIDFLQTHLHRGLFELSIRIRGRTEHGVQPDRNACRYEFPLPLRKRSVRRSICRICFHAHASGSLRSLSLR